jgi:hypothetical protein
MTRPASWLRGGLGFLALSQAVVGAWAYLFPRLFYDHAPTVHLGRFGPPFNEHFVSDTGGLYLATAVVLGMAAAYLERRLVYTSLASYLVFSVSHLLFHLRHLVGFPVVDSVLLPTGLIFEVLIASVLLVLARGWVYTRSDDPRIDSGPGRTGSMTDRLR